MAFNKQRGLITYFSSASFIIIIIFYLYYDCQLAFCSFKGKARTKDQERRRLVLLLVGKVWDKGEFES